MDSVTNPRRYDVVNLDCWSVFFKDWKLFHLVFSIVQAATGIYTLSSLKVKENVSINASMTEWLIDLHAAHIDIVTIINSMIYFLLCLVLKCCFNKEIIKALSKDAGDILKNWTIKNCQHEFIAAMGKLRHQNLRIYGIANFGKCASTFIKFILSYIFFNHNLLIFDILDHFFMFRCYCSSSYRTVSSAKKCKSYCYCIQMWLISIFITLFCIFIAISVIVTFYIAPGSLIRRYVGLIITDVVSYYAFGKIINSHQSKEQII